MQNIEELLKLENRKTNHLKNHPGRQTDISPGKINIKHKNLLIFSEMAIIVSKKKKGGRLKISYIETSYFSTS